MCVLVEPLDTATLAAGQARDLRSQLPGFDGFRQIAVHGIEPHYQWIRTIDIERGRSFRFTDE